MIDNTALLSDFLTLVREFSACQSGSARHNVALSFALFAATGLGVKLEVDGHFISTLANLAGTWGAKPDAAQSTGPTCVVSNQSAQVNPVKAYLIPEDGFASEFRAALQIYREVMEKAGKPIPHHINEGLIARLANMESGGGRNVYDPRNSYLGLFGISPDLPEDKSHFKFHLSRIVDVVNNVLLHNPSGTIRALDGCHTVDGKMLVDSKIFPDVRLQTIFALVLTSAADEELSKLPNYARLTAEQKAAVLYFHHNISSVAKLIVNNIDSPESIYTLVDRSFKVRAPA